MSRRIGDFTYPETFRKRRYIYICMLRMEYKSTPARGTRLTHSSNIDEDCISSKVSGEYNCVFARDAVLKPNCSIYDNRKAQSGGPTLHDFAASKIR
jgi:hypothetical protein